MVLQNENISNAHTTQHAVTFTIPQSIIRILAVIGFMTLITFGIMLGIHIVKFIPSIFGTLESSKAYLSSVISSKDITQRNLTIIPQTTIPFNTKTSKNTKEMANGLLSTSTITKKVGVKNKHTNRHTHWHTGSKKITNQLLGTSNGGIATTTKYYGLPDLATVITSVGYLTGTSTNTFIAGNVMPANAQIVVKFRIINQGTNVTGPWNLEIHIPTEINSIYPSKIIKSLYPGQPEDFIVRFTNAVIGVNKKITVIADPKNAIKESHKKNNSASMNITVLGN